ncbi:desmoglein-2.1-like [Diretmus argenteus]
MGAHVSSTNSPQLFGCLGGGEASMQLRRQKRVWLIPGQRLKENQDYSPRYFVTKFTGVAKFPNGTVADGAINLRFSVEDENDNPPIFDPVPTAYINESSPPGTLVTTVMATDADKANSPHSKIAYSIEKQEPSDVSDLFSIDREKGFIYVQKEALDRERVSSYVLTIKGTDMDGAPGGNTGNTTVNVKVVDINDNMPALEKDEYSGSIMENTANVEVTRFKVLDADEENTDNTRAVFDIVSGNEDGTFSIKTDPKTNEGILMLEKHQLLGMERKMVGVEEKGMEREMEEVVGVVQEGVVGVQEGVEVQEGVVGGQEGVEVQEGEQGGMEGAVVVGVQEGEQGGVEGLQGLKEALHLVIAVYPATDTDSGKPAENVRYFKGHDPGNWLLIDPETAEITLKSVPDRESPFLINGTYYAKILCLMQGVTPKMTTGTIALQVGDVNDNCPKLTSSLEYICSDTEVVNITAEDEDGDPNGAPLLFSLAPEESRDKWEVESFSDTGASLRALRPLWPGHYKVSLIIQDQQGVACPEPQQLELQVCSCAEGEEVPLLSSPGQIIRTAMPVMFSSNIAAKTAANTKTVSSSYNNSRLSLYNDDMGQRRMYSLAMEEQTLGYEDIALPDEYLHAYYSQKASCAAENQVVMDSLLMYTYNGQGSPAGSVGCCSDLESDDDLQFLNDLGPKFKTLAKICSPEPLTPPEPATAVIANVDQFEKVARPLLESKPAIVNNENANINNNVTISQSSISPTAFYELSTCNIDSNSCNIDSNSCNIDSNSCNVNITSNIDSNSFNIASNIAQSASISSVTTVPHPDQTVLLQEQPVYYTTTPWLQPMHYIVQPQLQSTVLLAETPAINLQGMVVVDGNSAHTQQITNGGNISGTFTRTKIKQGWERRAREEASGEGVMAWGKATVDGGVVMGGGRSGQKVLVEDGARLEHFHNNIGILPAAQSIMLMGREVSVGSEQEPLGQVAFVGGQHIIVQNPTNMGSVPQWLHPGQSWR